MVIILSRRLAEGITRPIEKLTESMKKVENGDLDVIVDINTNDEIGSLSKSYENMILRIKQLMNRIVQDEKEKRRSELRILQAQINPHFLYNTLDTLQWKAYENGQDDMVTIIQSLSTFFRISLSKGKEFIPLSKEIEHVKSYLVIQKNRFEDYSEFIELIGSDSKCIRSITLKKVDYDSVNFNVTLNNGYKFDNKPIWQLSCLYVVNNLSFKNIVSNAEHIDIEFNGNLVLEWAKKISNFESLRDYINTDEHWKALFGESAKYIQRFYVNIINKQQISFSIFLKEGYLFKKTNKNYRKYYVGNLVYLGETPKPLNQIKVRFNQRFFYKLMVDKTINNWSEFLDLLRPNLFNFTDSMNATLWSNITDSKLFNRLFVTIDNDKLKVVMQLVDGYFFGNNKWDVYNELIYTKEQIKAFYDGGRKLIEDEKTQTIITIAISVGTPFIILFIAAVIIITKFRKENKRLGGE